MTTQAIALRREQVLDLLDQFRVVEDMPDVLSVFLITTTDDESREYLEDGLAADQPVFRMKFDSLSLGDVYTVMVDYEVTHEVMQEMGLKEV